MDGLNFWEIILLVVGVFSVIPIIIHGIIRLRILLSSALSYKHLRVKAIGRRSYSGYPHVTIKIAFTGTEEIIIDELNIQSKLSYPRRIDAVFAWLQLGIGYILDDVEGLKNVLGNSFPTLSWLPSGPIHRINNAFIRKPISFILGIYVFYYLIISILPIFWIFLFAGPYAELRLFSGNERVRLLEKGKEDEEIRPFILKSGTESTFNMSYKPSLFYNLLFGQKMVFPDAKIFYLKRTPRFRKLKLPHGDDFCWKVIDILRIKVSGKWREYNVNLGASYANIRF